MYSTSNIKNQNKIEEIKSNITEELEKSERLGTFPEMCFTERKISDVIAAVEEIEFDLSAITLEFKDCLGEFGTISGATSGDLEELEELNISVDIVNTPSAMDTVEEVLHTWVDLDELIEYLLEMSKGVWQVNLKFTDEHLLFRNEMDGKILRFDKREVMSLIKEHFEEAIQVAEDIKNLEDHFLLC